MAITGPHQGCLWCCWFQKPQAHCGADPCIWEGMGEGLKVLSDT